MNTIQTIAKCLEANTTWTIYVTTDDRISIFDRTNYESLWLGTMVQDGSDINLITRWHKNAIIPLADPELLTKIIETIAQDHTRYLTILRKYEPIRDHQ